MANIDSIMLFDTLYLLSGLGLRSPIKWHILRIRTHCRSVCKLTPKKIGYHFWCKLSLTFLLKQHEANISPMINVKTFIPVVIVVILRNHQNTKGLINRDNQMKSKPVLAC